MEKLQPTILAEGKLSPRPFELRMMVVEDEAQPMRQDAPAVLAAFEATNGQLIFEPVPQLGYDGKKNALLATANIPDVIQVNDRDLQQFACSGTFLPISDYLERMPNFAAAISTRPDVDTLRVDGKLYGFPVLEQFKFRVCPQPQIRMDLLEKNGLGVPTTFDELFAVLQAMKREDPGIIGVGGRDGTKYVLGQWPYRSVRAASRALSATRSTSSRTATATCTARRRRTSRRCCAGSTVSTKPDCWTAST